MADVTYNTSSFPSLVRTLDKLLRLGDNGEAHLAPTVLLAYKERDASERTLWEMSTHIGLHFNKISDRAGAGGPPVEIWVARLEHN